MAILGMHLRWLGSIVEIPVRLTNATREQLAREPPADSARRPIPPKAAAKKRYKKRAQRILPYYVKAPEASDERRCSS